MKKQVLQILAFCLAVLLTVGLTSCGKKGTDKMLDVTAPDAGQTEEAELTEEEEQPHSGINPLTGLPGYDTEKYKDQKLIGVVVENHPGARPQWSMNTPDVIFEYEVEGGISRMLWLYANLDEIPERLGPVRSMRHDIVELARGYDLFFIHCGGSKFAWEKVKTYNGTLAEIDGGYHPSLFYRDTTRNTAIEHRLLLLGNALRATVEKGKLDMTTDSEHQYIFRFANEEDAFYPGDEVCNSVHFEYSGNYTYTFNYNDETGLYEANINGSPRVDDQDVQCAYTNLILLYVDMEDMGTESGHQDLKLEKGGKGIYAANGTYEEIKWEKGDDEDMLKLYEPDGEELVLNAGKSYIGLVRSTQSSKTEIS